MIDLAETRATIFGLRRMAVVLDGEGTDLLPAGVNVGNWIVVFIVQHVAGVIADLHCVITDFGNDAGAIGPRCGIAAMLFDHDGHAGAARNWPQLLQIAYPGFVLACLYGPERQHKWHSGGGRLLNSSGMHAHGFRSGHINFGKHHDRLEAHGAAVLGEAFGFGGRGISPNNGFLAAGRVLMRFAPPTESPPSPSTPLQPPLPREFRIS